MAELVHLRLEHTLPELEEMERIGLFTRKEIRSIVKKRKRFEYRLRRKLKTKEDFLIYIEYEMNLLSLIGKRRERLLCEDKKVEIDNSIAKRINRLFKGVISRYSEDEKLWLDQIQFSKQMKWYDSINVLHTRMLQVHSKSPALWIMAAKWEMEGSRSPENARKLLQRGVLLNPLSEILWREYFRMEMMYIDLIRKRRAVLEDRNMENMETDETDVVLKGQVANVVYDKAVEAVDDVEFALSFIQICLDFEFCSRHIDYILSDVKERFPHKEETLDALAKRPLLDVEGRIKKGKEIGIKIKTTLDLIREEICTKYEEAVQILPTEKMWSFYIDFILSQLNAAKKHKSGLRNAAILLMERADLINCLAVVYYSEWIDLLFEKGDKDTALKISLSTAKRWNTVDLWYKCLTYHIQCMESHKDIYELLVDATSSVKEKDSLTLWKLGVDWLSISNPEGLVDFFERGIHKSSDVCVPLKAMYLEMTAFRKGVSEARKLYKKLKKMGPLSLQLLMKMIHLEKGQMSTHIEILRKYYEEGVKEFGSVNVDIWLDYMKLETEHPEGNPTSCDILYWKAKKTLEPDYQQDFLERTMDVVTGSNKASNLLLTE